MTNLEPKIPGPFPIGGVVRLAKRKKFLDWAAFVLTAPLLVAVVADVFRGPASEPPEWVFKNLGYWAAAFIAMTVLRRVWLRCPDCGGGFGQDGTRTFAPLPAACGKCGLLLSPVVKALEGKTVDATSSEPGSGRSPVRMGWVVAFAIAAGVLSARLEAEEAVSPLPPYALGVVVAAFVVLLGFAARKRSGWGRLCAPCGRQGFGKNFCEHCGAMRTNPPA